MQFKNLGKPMRNLTHTALLLICIFGSAIASAQLSSALGEQFDGFYRYVDRVSSQESFSREVRAKLVQRRYDDVFGVQINGDELNGLPGEDLHLLFDVASLTSLMNPEGPSYKDALLVLQTLGTSASGREIRAAQGMLFQARRFRDLDAFNVTYANRGLAKTPKVDTQPNAILHNVIVPTDAYFGTKQVGIGKGPRVIVVAHPLCHFTQDAMNAIQADPSLKGIMLRNAVWISPPDRGMDFTAFSRWNSVYPAAQISVAYSYSSWPELNEWGTPTFYFFLDERLVNTVVGWPRGGRMEELLRSLNAIGLVVKRDISLREAVVPD